MRRTITAVTTALVAVTLLAGCSGGDASGDDTDRSSSAPSATKTAEAAPAQTKTEACTFLEDELASFLKEQGSSSAPAEPAARAELIGEFTDRLDAALPKVTNEQVHDTFEDFTGAAKDYASAVRASGSTDDTAVQDAQADVEKTLDRVSTVCPAKG
ncbi:hypothetical protein I8920_13460 [Curtobacterium sp. YC1]|uniref:hypothetical protein n=1 Tax=Curtobacterium sp. YC1 TaxID=2795488 RepID=UPI0018E5518F|nr:hypothetical protein [Curtobacterium sp. YC1]QQD75804.1 hypothetical protein I8920_13460 [Curtobacterium sp. YC1]